MNARVFQVCLITLLAVFTALLILLLSIGLAQMFGSISQTGGITAVAGGVSASLLDLVAVTLVVVMVIAFVLWSVLRNRKARHTHHSPK